MITHSETITCPKCGQQFAVDDALSSQICGSMEADWHKLILMLEKQLAEQKEAFDQEAKKNSGQNAREESAQHLHEMQRALEECNKLVEYFRRQEFALRQKQRKVEEGPTHWSWMSPGAWTKSGKRCATTLSQKSNKRNAAARTLKRI